MYKPGKIRVNKRIDIYNHGRMVFLSHLQYSPYRILTLYIGGSNTIASFLCMIEYFFHCN